MYSGYDSMTERPLRKNVYERQLYGVFNVMHVYDFHDTTVFFQTKLEPVKFHDGTQFTNIDVMKKYEKEDFETGLRQM